MTTSHAAHNHPATPAARAACRKASAVKAPAPAPAPARRVNVTTTISARHCQGCGSTNLEDLMTGNQGYTACCNEPII